MRERVAVAVCTRGCGVAVRFASSCGGRGGGVAAVTRLRRGCGGCGGGGGGVFCLAGLEAGGQGYAVVGCAGGGVEALKGGEGGVSEL